MRSHYWILDRNGEPVAAEGALEWMWWMDSARDQLSLAQDKVRSGDRTIEVSTVFLGINYNWGSGPPLVFETMTFGGGTRDDLMQQRYSTRQDALRGHAEILATVLANASMTR